ncbi:MAG: arylsulfatase [bacterium]|nr:arylsulfatase [bacterium]
MTVNLLRSTWLITCTAILLLLNACTPAVETATGPPNILLILVDDMGYSDLSCYGSEIATPHIDSLAHNGLRLTQFYNAARCCPTRAALLTGLYPHQAGMGHQNQDKGLPSYSGRINDNATTIAEVLKQQGYTTYQVGKWHIGNTAPFWPGNKGFDQYLTLIEGAMSYFNAWPWAKNQDTLEMRYNGGAYHTPPDFFATDTFSDTAAAFIQRHDRAQPFFMYLAYSAPHWPLHVRPEDRSLYDGAYDEGWAPIREARLKKMKALGIIEPDVELTAPYPTVPKWDTLSATAQSEWSDKMELYAAVMHRLDLGVGKVVRALRESGQLDNTLILFLSDNGACPEDPLGPWITYPTDGETGGPYSFPAYELPWANVSNTPFRLFKSYLHEGGMRTPFIAHWPGQIPAGQTDRSSVGHVIDVLPTLASIANATYPALLGQRRITPTPGQSLESVLRGIPDTSVRTLFWEHQFNRAVREGDWKLVSAHRLPGQGPKGEWELYHLPSDPTEINNLAEAHPEKVEAMSRQYQTWADSVGAYDQATLKQLIDQKKSQ